MAQLLLFSIEAHQHTYTEIWKEMFNLIFLLPRSKNHTSWLEIQRVGGCVGATAIRQFLSDTGSTAEHV